jgi:3-methyladenine DNA glycosylase Tag
VARTDASSWVQSEHDLQRDLLKENRSNRAKAIAASRTAMYAMRKDEVQVLKQMRRENEAAMQAQRDLEMQRAVERKNIVRNHQKSAAQRKQAEQAVALARSKDSRESRRQDLDDEASSHLQAYSSLAEEEQRLIQSLQKWQSVQEDAFDHLDSVLGASKGASRAASRAGSRPVSRHLSSRGGSGTGGISPRAPPPGGPAAAPQPPADFPPPS